MTIDSEYQPIRPVTIDDLRAVATARDDYGTQKIVLGYRYEFAGESIERPYIWTEQAQNALSLLEDHWHTKPSIVVKDADLIATWFFCCGDVVRVVFRDSEAFLLAVIGNTFIEEPIKPSRPTKLEFLLDTLPHRAKMRGGA